MNEEKVREAQHIAEVFLSGYNGADETVAAINDRLIEAMQPERPEIPEGCPVLVWNDGEEDLKYIQFYGYNNASMYDHVEIDYQRKGHVIPWHGGECPVDGNTLVAVMFRSGIQSASRLAIRFSWKSSNGTTTEHTSDNDIIAYVIWPEWVK